MHQQITAGVSRVLPGMIVERFGPALRSAPSAATLKASAPVSRESKVLEVMDHPGGISKGAQMFAEERQRDPNAVLFSEAVMNRIGYGRL